ncbi:MAG TPA: hypothetical protein VMD29_09295 [Terracidiphilus sp.]|nr:hypothetical protein [Terracidiphilus sp.]
MGTTLIMQGTLRGMGCEVHCSLIVTRSESLNGLGGTYTKCAVLDAPVWLPDGYYEVIFCGQSAFLHRVNRIWSVGIPWRENPVRSGVAEERSAMMERPAMRSREPLIE